MAIALFYDNAGLVGQTGSIVAFADETVNEGKFYQIIGECSETGNLRIREIAEHSDAKAGIYDFIDIPDAKVETVECYKLVVIYTTW